MEAPQRALRWSSSWCSRSPIVLLLPSRKEVTFGLEQSKIKGGQIGWLSEFSYK
ncbi:hypothetical protein SLEP1_g37163 [Rubroshorea leprosula]|uniref:Uncharacterized protein n=1 Tax=Rubroshorea leprosula TaxID=152421 RepID=A0AAV5KU14_9ROSI|nr:hypothetical protein SLEP1_g37163 [Rubroshorea leprosula]